MEAIETVIDFAILGTLYVAATYGFVALFWNVIFPAVAGKEKDNDN